MSGMLTRRGSLQLANGTSTATPTSASSLDVFLMIVSSAQKVTLTRATKRRTGGWVRKSAWLKLNCPMSLTSGSGPRYLVQVTRLRPEAVKLNELAPRCAAHSAGAKRSEEHTSELQSH